MNHNVKFFLTFSAIFIGAFLVLFILKATIKEDLIPDIFQEEATAGFVDVAKQLGVGDPIESLKKQQSPELSSYVHFGAGWGDLTNDGCLDLYVANPNGKNVLFENDCEGGFDEIGESAGVAYAGVSHSVGFGDIENDGCLDIYVANENEPNLLYRNNCDGTFSDITKTSDTAGSDGIPGSVSWVDYNNDGLLDIFIANGTSTSDVDVEGEKDAWKLIVTSGENNLYKNNGDGTFSDLAKTAGIAGVEKRIIYSTANEKASLEISGVSLSAAWFHYNDDLCIDLIIASDIGISPLYKNNCDGTFTDVTAYAFSGMDEIWYGGSSWGDFDGDGLLDVYVAGYVI